MARSWRAVRAVAVAAGQVDEVRVVAERRRIEQEQTVHRQIPAACLPIGDARDAEHDLMMRLGEAVNAAHHLAAVAPREARAVGLDDMVDRWERQLAVFHWRTVGARGTRSTSEARSRREAK